MGQGEMEWVRLQGVRKRNLGTFPFASHQPQIPPQRTLQYTTYTHTHMPITHHSLSTAWSMSLLLM